MNKADNNIRFILDGELKLLQFGVDDGIHPDTSLLHYLRGIGHTGVKEGCGEGDCGACTVVIARPEGNHLRYHAINSCLVFLPMIHGCQVISVHSLTSSDKEGSILHPVQKALVDHHGSQCGYCTPGIVMSMFALWKNHERFTPSMAKEALAGNLCRCTGYQPLVDALMTLSGTSRDDHFKEKETIVMEELLAIREASKSIVIEQGDLLYLKTFSLASTLKLRHSHPEAKIISGATDVAVAKNKHKEEFNSYLDISSVDELRFINEEKKCLAFGPCISMEELALAAASKLQALHEMIGLFGSLQIRNMASPGGNIAGASPIGDLLPVLMAYGCELELSSISGSRNISLENFILDYHKTDLRDDELITAIKVPFPREDEIIRSYKVSKRKDVDISSVSAAFLMQTDTAGMIKKVRLYYGGMAATTVRATEAESFLMGKKWNRQLAIETSRIISRQFEPISDARSSASGRRIMSENLLIRFWEESNLKE